MQHPVYCDIYVLIIFIVDTTSMSIMSFSSTLIFATKIWRYEDEMRSLETMLLYVCYCSKALASLLLECCNFITKLSITRSAVEFILRNGRSYVTLESRYIFQCFGQIQVVSSFCNR